MWLEYILNYIPEFNSFEFRIYSWIKNFFEIRILGINTRINSKNMEYELNESSCKWFRRCSFRPTSSKSNQWETIRRKTFSNSHDRLLNGCPKSEAPLNYSWEALSHSIEFGEGNGLGVSVFRHRKITFSMLTGLLVFSNNFLTF